MNKPCQGIWFNDREADHVHRCDYEPGHVGYHFCGHQYGYDEQNNLPILCGIGF